jgi:hypothetical protein
MTRTRRVVRTVAAAAGITFAAATALAVPASAGTLAWPNDTYDLCTTACGAEAIGGVTWGNRSATVQGTIHDIAGSGSTVFFEAYAGSTKITSTTRTAAPGAVRSYNFSIGDPDLVGGFDRLKITVCESDHTWCTVPVNADRDGVAEHLVQ